MFAPYAIYRGCVASAKLTSKNQLTLPKAVVADFHGYEYFEVSQQHGRILLTPARINRAGAVRAKLAELGITEADIHDAVDWARTVEVIPEE